MARSAYAVAAQWRDRPTQWPMYKRSAVGAREPPRVPYAVGRLPVVMVAKILAFVGWTEHSEMKKVCRAWKCAVDNPEAWKMDKAPNNWNTLPAAVARRMRFQSICVDRPPFWMMDVLRDIPTWTSLHLINCHSKDVGRLWSNGRPVYDLSLQDTTLEKRIAWPASLTKLSVAKTTFHAPTEFPSDLVDLTFKDVCFAKTAETTEMESLFRHLPSLKTLVLANVFNGHDMPLRGDVDWSRMTNLTSLTLRCLAQEEKTGQDRLAAITQHCLQLVCLQIFVCPSQIDWTCLSRLSSLATLHLDMGDGDDYPQSLRTLCPAVIKLPCLSKWTLHFGRKSIDAECESPLDGWMSGMALASKTLVHVCFEYGPPPSTWLKDVCRAPNLRRLSLASTHRWRFDAADMHTLATTASVLERIDFGRALNYLHASSPTSLSELARISTLRTIGISEDMPFFAWPPHLAILRLPWTLSPTA